VYQKLTKNAISEQKRYRRENSITPKDKIFMQNLCVGPLVRATSTTSTVIWAEFDQPCTVTLSATLAASPEQPPIQVTTRTISIGGHHYATPQLQGLEPARWYNYHLETSALATSDANKTTSTPNTIVDMLRCFRTLDEAETRAESSLRVLYGSCRLLNQPEKDTLDALGQWLIKQVDLREQVWPHVLLLIGDQIYADIPPPPLVQMRPSMKDGATSFEDFASQYRYVWTTTTSVRQALACIPTYMTCDDHEITNGWNGAPTWRTQMLQSGREQTLIDGMVAYWVYQEWGNLDQQEVAHPLMRIMKEAEQTGEDALEALRTCIKQTIFGDTDLHWHYTIPTTPPIFVTSTRINRSCTPYNNERYAPTHIMSTQQMAELRGWLQEQQAGVSLLVSSVPVLLPPFIGFAEYLAGVRLWTQASAPLRWLGRQLARLQLKVAELAQFEHWPVYTTSWHELVQSVAQQTGDVVILGGDVHFSYTIEGRPVISRQSHTPSSRLYQLVSTPIQNSLHTKERRLIQGQAFIKRAIYGSLSTRVLPLQMQNAHMDTHHDLLFENTLAHVTITLHPEQEHRYDLEQEYLGIVDGQLQVIGRTLFSRNTRQ
jgi:phosphodiesterase/alkaline phosphatase D-like protein